MQHIKNSAKVQGFFAAIPFYHNVNSFFNKSKKLFQFHKNTIIYSTWILLSLKYI